MMGKLRHKEGRGLSESGGRAAHLSHTQAGVLSQTIRENKTSKQMPVGILFKVLVYCKKKKVQYKVKINSYKHKIS